MCTSSVVSSEKRDTAVVPRLWFENLVNTFFFSPSLESWVFARWY